MARFNLGCITGSKGEPGPKGEKGDKGDKGDRGERGADGITPVFGINSVKSVDSSMDALVEIDSSEPAQPKLTFYIPRGADGKDAVGDMVGDIYDRDGRKEDVFSYARDLFDNALKKSGGQMTGKIVASDGELCDRCVRNIIFSSELPTTAAEGDLCIVLAEKSGGKLADWEEGSVLLIDEGGEKVPYIITAKDYYKNGTVTLIRKHVVNDNTVCFDYKVRDSYCCSDIDIYLESVFIRNFSDLIQKNLVSVKLSPIYQRHCFLPCQIDFENMEYFKGSAITATLSTSSSAESYMIRDINARKQAIIVDEKGNYSSSYQYNKMRYRPIINLPADFKVANSIYNSETVMEPIEDIQKIYLYTDGEWKELVL